MDEKQFGAFKGFIRDVYYEMAAEHSRRGEDFSKKDFAGYLGIPYSTVHGWLNDDQPRQLVDLDYVVRLYDLWGTRFMRALGAKRIEELTDPA